jgi:hypothetical protein
VAPRTKPAPISLGREDEERLVHAVQQAADGQTLVLTEEEVRTYAETGVLRGRVEYWAASRR